MSKHIKSVDISFDTTTNYYPMDMSWYKDYLKSLHVERLPLCPEPPTNIPKEIQNKLDNEDVIGAVAAIENLTHYTDISIEVQKDSIRKVTIINILGYRPEDSNKILIRAFEIADYIDEPTVISFPKSHLLL